MVTDGEKSSTVLPGSVAGRRISVQMFDQCTACTRTGTYTYLAKVEHKREGASAYTRSRTAHNIILTAIVRRCAMSQSNTSPVIKLAPLTTRHSSLRYVSAAEHHTAEKYSKTSMTKHQRHLPRSNLSVILVKTSSRYQVFEKLFWKPNEYATQKSSRNQMSLPMYQGHQTAL